MYNRYIPQPDGTYRRDRVPVNPLPPQSKCDIPPPICPPQPPPGPPKPHVETQTHFHTPTYTSKNAPIGIGSFFRRLLPKDLDTADLLIIILLLLMAGDKEEEQTNALLTLALYFFM